MSYDLVVRGGTIVDGSGLPRARADVRGNGSTIVAVGRIDGAGRREVDAEGLVVTPGFVDGHTHMDAQVFWDPIGSCLGHPRPTAAARGEAGAWPAAAAAAWRACAWAPAASRWRRRPSRNASWWCATWSAPRTSPVRPWLPGS